MKAIVDKNDFLDKYTEKTKDGTEFIPYPKWRNIKKASGNLEIESNFNEVWIKDCITGEELLRTGILSSAGKAICDILEKKVINKWANVSEKGVFTPARSTSCTTSFDNVKADIDKLLSGINGINFTVDGKSYTSYPGNSVTAYLSGEFPITSFNEKENEKMNTSNLIKFDFGPVSSSRFRMSPYGIAVCTNNNGWVAYNKDSGEIFDVDVLNFDVSKFIYKMPVAQKDVAIGDILIHANQPVFVRAINENGTIEVVNYVDATVVNILPVKSPFGFNFFTKVCSLFDFSTLNADKDNPFGNMLPFLLMGGGEFNPLMFLAMNNGGKMDMNNPLMMYALMNGQGDKKNDDNSWLVALMMTMNAPAAK